MKYFHRTSVSPDEVTEAATRFFGAKLIPAAEEPRGREFAGSIGRTDLPGGDFATIERSLARVAKLDADLVVLPGHGPDTTIARERAQNPYLQG